MKQYSIFLLLIILYSCQLKNEQLEYSLQLAGDNRAELEKVLTHYSQNPADSLKYRAAVFLISNMAGHYSLCYFGFRFEKA
jgi:hypothetical protein